MRMDMTNYMHIIIITSTPYMYMCMYLRNMGHYTHVYLVMFQHSVCESRQTCFEAPSSSSDRSNR